MEDNFNRKSIRHRVQDFMARLLPGHVDNRGNTRRMRRYIRSSSKDVLDLLAYEQIAGLMGTASDFEDIRTRKVTLQLRIADEIANGDLTLADIRRMDPQVQHFCLEVMKAHQVKAADNLSENGDKKTVGLRQRLQKMLSQKSLL
ncbi:unnamed protein product [Bursaphelenchus okinawaensis]|uniref:Uncharacterized protein n=1 Tax=Bursaphelenchus okinawaensis TaxID=465554 RepID=A0A811JVV0_9BILA|nr:unnamed protein product [Bursaphelenchus okinawaensis]CAG9085565.1 unnamed protein product [Bursaphelenchus okinawaensis]